MSNMTNLNETTSYEARKRSSRPHLLFRHRKKEFRLGKDQLLRQAGTRPETAAAREDSRDWEWVVSGMAACGSF